MAKQQRTLRISEETILMVENIAKNEFGNNFTAAIESMVKHSHLIRQIDEDDRDRLRVSSKRGPHGDIYDKHERKMINFFLV